MDGMTVWIPYCYEEAANRAVRAAQAIGFDANVEVDDTPGIEQLRLEVGPPEQQVGDVIATSCYETFTNLLDYPLGVECFALTIYTSPGLYKDIARALFEPRYAPEYMTQY
ncbi:MAG: hypothetical protein AVDCRST_MAG93-8613 [uncultured Chloroflexia bacterium]|uniref:Uncharacterized protein n=1 Tax=uncultured Chloroflexia bacterium TaxID=1672391 RepID=A0A6J4N316_9CHLR|nr:MAG: hypothetical protein AVDCRST_MAG93-8613 [uncultured Chloroflexia bacterium]